MRISDWSSDVCSSDLRGHPLRRQQPVVHMRDAERIEGKAEPAEREAEREQQRPRRLDRERGADPERRREAADDHAAAVEAVGQMPDRPLQGDAAKDHHHHERSEEHTSELQSLMRISYAVFCLKKKTTFNI